MQPEEDTHFYIDDAPPEEVLYVLRVLSLDVPMSSQEIGEALETSYGFSMQSDKNYSPRRLYDLRLAERERERSSVKYRLSEAGAKLQTLASTDQALCTDLLHYLHYTTYTGSPEDRKLFWSYRRCCDYIWTEGQLIPSRTLASRIQSDIAQEFPHLDQTKRVGARFKDPNQGIAWTKALQPCPFDDNGKVRPRIVSNFQLLPLALDHVYRNKGFAYGSAMVLTDDVLDAVARVFFLDPPSCRQLLAVAAQFTSALKFSDTLAGTAVTLTRPYTVMDL